MMKWQRGALLGRGWGPMRKTKNWREVGALCLSLMFGALGGCDEQQPEASASAGAEAAAQQSPDARAGELCISLADCGKNEYCATAEGSCGREGVCTAVPEVCEYTREPVCGCDGVNYDNPCFASQWFQSVNNQGSCVPPPCFSNADCGATSYCLKATGDCGGAGTCTVRPTLCSAKFKPVCGCNNATYTNACKAGSLGVTLFKNGAC